MTDIKYGWEDCTQQFWCPFCGEEIIADSQMGHETCECGMEYYLSAHIVIVKPGNKNEQSDS